MKRFLLNSVCGVLCGITVVAASAADYNAVQISLRNGNSHYIAIDGKNLKISAGDQSVTLGNSGARVEYGADEIEKFVPGNYQFGTGEFYMGDKPNLTGVESIADDSLVVRIETRRLSIAGLRDASQVAIYNSAGTCMATCRPANGTAAFDTSAFSAGVYILQAGTQSIKFFLGE